MDRELIPIDVDESMWRMISTSSIISSCRISYRLGIPIVDRPSLVFFLFCSWEMSLIESLATSTISYHFGTYSHARYMSGKRAPMIDILIETRRCFTRMATAPWAD